MHQTTSGGLLHTAVGVAQGQTDHHTFTYKLDPTPVCALSFPSLFLPPLRCNPSGPW
jgi:hypothetical protein